ncbi:hypothetical protein A9Q84_00100 [Halobacteriovorax marinus]|uniref:UmuC domain-containing protein n=1 Tax=Halobacteriovorax marinus TaxID=97084 RepID=A0A1Y5FDI6_9BACT|nr:hypothetical protein A9Q84_00100 [Halobacteriovorax marinus]
MGRCGFSPRRDNLSKKIFALVDCNSFYCSCERLFRPDLKSTAIGVLSNNDGCFVSRTPELKKLGVKTGDPYFKVKDLCKKNNVAVFSANFSLYTNLSDRVMKTLATFAPRIEVYSVDEAFLDLTGFNPDELVEYSREIKRIVERDTGIPVSVGVGYTKTLAKLANNLAKKSKKAGGVVCLLNDKHTEAALERTQIGDVWGIGRASESKLKAIGIHNAKDFKEYKNSKNILKLLTKVGLQTKEELEGNIRLNLEIVPIKKKEIMCSRTFGTPVFDMKVLRESISNYITNTAEKLRKQDSSCSKIEIFARTSPYKDVPQHFAFEQVILSGDSSNTLKMISYAFSAVEKLFKEGYEFKKAGVKLTNIVNDTEGQLSLLDENDSPRTRSLMKTIDLINKINGPGTIKSAACGVNDKAWSMSRNFKSPRYVTGYTELPKVT